MNADSAAAIKREVHELIDLQIQTLRQDSRLQAAQLSDYRMRSQRIKALYQELDQISRNQLITKISRAS